MDARQRSQTSAAFQPICKFHRSYNGVNCDGVAEKLSAGQMWLSPAAGLLSRISRLREGRKEGETIENFFIVL